MTWKFYRWGGLRRLGNVEFWSPPDYWNVHDQEWSVSASVHLLLWNGGMCIERFRARAKAEDAQLSKP